MNSIMSGRKILSAFALALGALLLCACPRVDPVDPVGPEGPDGPEVPEKPYFNLMTSSGTSVPQDGTTTYDYYPDYPDKGRIFYFDQVVGAGYAHLWPFVAHAPIRYEVGSWNLAERIVVGRFVEGKEEPQEFKGDVPFHFQPGTLYRLTGKLIGALGEFGDTAVRYNNTIGQIPYFY